MKIVQRSTLAFFSFLLIACAPPKASFQIQDLNSAKQTEQSATSANKQDSTNPIDTKLSTTGKDKNQTTTVAHRGAAPGSWDLSGGIAARGKNKSWTASINWLQRGAGTYQIRLNGPLGSGAVLVEKRGGVISFRDGPKSVSSRNADELLSQQTGIRLPVSSLYYWVRGIPSPGAVQAEQRDAAGNLTLLKQGGYTISYQGYRNIGSASLPTQIRLQGNGVFIKLAVSSWKV